MERVPSITGRVISSRADALPEDPPSWTGGRYNITLVNDGSNWKIIGMQQTAELLESDESNEEGLLEEGLVE